MKKLLASGGLLAFAALLLGSSTFAWFSMNKTVTAKGMMVKAKTDASMIISKDFPTTTSKSFEYDFKDQTATELLPSTHDSAWGTYALGLKYVTNTSSVDPVTGMQATGAAAFTYAAVTSTNKDSYCKDYSVFIAARGGSLTGQNLKVTINDAAVSDINGAVSADFFMAKVTSTTASGDITAYKDSKSNYKGTLSAGRKDSLGKDKADFTASSIDIPPVDVGEGETAYALKVTIRVYVDGALPTSDSKTKYFINDQNAIQVDNTDLAFKFEASTPTGD